MSLFEELKRRNVIRVGGAYLALGWIVVQITATVVPVMHLPEWIAAAVVWAGVIGFPFVVMFAWIYELTPEGLKRESEVVREASVTAQTAQKLDRIIIALLVVAIGLFAFHEFRLSPAADSGADGRAHGALLPEDAGAGHARDDADPVGAGHARDQTAPADAHPAGGGNAAQGNAASAPDSHSIAVLPFVDMSAEKDQEYMSDGIAEELLNLLAKIPELQVTSRSSAFAFKGEKIDIADVAAKLHVAHILEGSVRKAGNRVRITAQLIDARADKHLWSESYDRTLDDIFAVQDEIAGAVVTQLKVALLGAAPKVKATDPKAYALFLQAQQMRRQGSRGSMEKAVELFKQSLALDPNYAPAWEGLGADYVNLAGNGWLGSFDQGFALARQTVEKSLAVDPDFGPAHARLGSIAMNFDGDLAAAARHVERALQLAPADAVVLSIASGLEGYLGRVYAALPIDTLLAERDPVNPFMHSSLGSDYLFLGRYDEAIASFRTALALSPGADTTHFNIALALLRRKELDAALAELQQEPSDPWRLVGLVIVQHARGQAAESDAALKAMVEKYEAEMSYQVAFLHAYRGEADLAFEWLEKALAYKDPGLSEIPVTHMFDDIRNDPRWLPFLRRIGKAPEQLAAIQFKVNLPQ